MEPDNKHTNSTKDRKSFNTSSVVLISLAHLLHDTFGAFLAPLRPLLIEKHRLSFSLAATLDLYQRLPSLLSPFIGLLADRMHLRWLVILSPGVTTVAMSLMGMAPSYLVLAVLLLVAGLSSAAFHVPTPVMVRQLSGESTGRGMSFYMLGGEIARTLGPLLITAALGIWGMEGSWRLIPFGLTASFILYIKLRHIRVSEAILAEREKKKKGSSWAEALRYSRFFLILGAYLFFVAILKSGLTAFLPTFYYSDKGESLWFANTSLAILQLAGAAGTMISGTLSDRLGRKSTLLLLAASTPLLMFLFLQSSGIFSIFFLILLGLFLMGHTPVLLAVIQDLPSSRPAFLNGIFMTLSFSIGSLAVVLNGAFADWIGLENMYYLGTGLALGAIPLIWWLPGKRKEKA